MLGLKVEASFKVPWCILEPDMAINRVPACVFPPQYTFLACNLTAWLSAVPSPPSGGRVWQDCVVCLANLASVELYYSLTTLLLLLSYYPAPSTVVSGNAETHTQHPDTNIKIVVLTSGSCCGPGVLALNILFVPGCMVVCVFVCI
mmetsp:Transcript_47351/g.84705  ORF Transcript_47351/g.84705 Transcript_47351/m.84705 type:complete len:146 (-) Transcript_47351:186-623(-)